MSTVVRARWQMGRVKDRLLSLVKESPNLLPYLLLRTPVAWCVQAWLDWRTVLEKHRMAWDKRCRILDWIVGPSSWLLCKKVHLLVHVVSWKVECTVSLFTFEFGCVNCLALLADMKWPETRERLAWLVCSLGPLLYHETNAYHGLRRMRDMESRPDYNPRLGIKPSTTQPAVGRHKK